MKARKVYFAVFGSGLGHVTRVLEVARRLGKEGREFRFSSSGQGLRYLRANGEGGNVVEVPPLDVEWAGGGFSSWHVLPKFPFMFNTFVQQLAVESRSISEFDPDIVVSDSRLSAVLAASAKSYPVVTILNQFSIAFPPRFRNTGGMFYERVAGDGLGMMWALSKRVLMTDLPPPYTIGEANLVGSDVARLVEYVGFTSPDPKLDEGALRRTKEALRLGQRPLVFCQISGPDATKGAFSNVILKAVEEVSKEYDVVISLGYPGGSPEPRSLGNGAWLYEWCPVKDELFALADLIVARAGHGTIGQCINSGKPGILVPIYNHPEQIGNAEKFDGLGLGMGVRSERFSPVVLAKCVKECIEDKSYRRNAEALRTISARYNGMQMCADIVRAYA